MIDRDWAHLGANLKELSVEKLFSIFFYIQTVNAHQIHNNEFNIKRDEKRNEEIEREREKTIEKMSLDCPTDINRPFQFDRMS